MDRDYGQEIDVLQKDMAEIKELLQEFVKMNVGANRKESESGQKYSGEVQIMHGMHPDSRLSDQMEELCIRSGELNVTGLISYMGVFASGGRQSNWIRNQVKTDMLLELIENHTAEKVLHCIGNSDRLAILLAILRKPRTVAELVEVCGLNSTGQAYHHMKPLLAADLIAEDNASGSGGRGVYIVQPHKVQGVIMLLAGIADMTDETYTSGSWEEE
ncbi:MAG: helix-turn-helix domain-containing protein [Lachnospiraceae bacterium]|nr:helix-turn-helix domain-containing protein [Lachnospiraceae bacterium]